MKTEFIIITGLSGAGKSLAVKCFEDLGFFCVDNLPIALIPKFAELCNKPESEIDRIVLVVDVREGEFLDDFFYVLKDISVQNINYRILFLEASNEVITRRFNETRRKHPLSTKEMTLLDCINKERRILQKIRDKADIIINTSTHTPNQLRQILRNAVTYNTNEALMTLNLVSFGYRFGIPNDADLIFDVRFLPNPHYVEELSPLTGNEKDVFDFVLKHEISKTFLKKFKDFLFFLLPQYIEEGKSYLTLAIGCTGGKHRSVVIANYLASEIKKKKYKINLIINHRDINRK
jgi:UPF0042 nucleotide-binding protein